jgi:hypothetical protein
MTGFVSRLKRRVPAQMPDYLIFTCVSIPTVKSIKKNKTAQSGETGNLDIVSGYVMKASPGPKIECRSNVTFWRYQ